MTKKPERKPEVSTDRTMISNRRRANVLARLSAFASSLVSRIGLAGRLGNQTFEGHRKLYKVFGYPDTVTFDEMYSTYRRQGIGKRLVKYPAQESWKRVPEIRDGDGDFKEAESDTQFVKDWDALARRLRAWSYFMRADKLAGIGQYGILFLGVKDGKEFDQPVDGKVSDILYLQPFMQSSVSIQSYDEETQSPRFGKVEMYDIDFGKSDHNKGDHGQAPGTTLSKKSVHHTRVLHIAEELDEDEIHGAPRLEDVYNDLLDLLKVGGGSAESFWLLANRGMQVDIKDGSNMSPDDIDDLNDELDEYFHDLRRVIRTSGVDIKELGGRTVDPRGMIQSLISLIAGAKGWPQRMLVGSERGELASSTDQETWAGVISARQEQFCEPIILRPFVDWCIEHSVIRPPTSGVYVIEWPSIFEQSDLEKATVFKTEVAALKMATPKPLGELVTQDELRGQVPWAEGEWDEVAAEAFGEEEMAETTETTETELPPESGTETTTPETQSRTPRAHGTHDFELVQVRCPLPDCHSYLARAYPDHKGLLVCHECERTFDPEIEVA